TIGDRHPSVEACSIGYLLQLLLDFRGVGLHPLSAVHDPLRSEVVTNAVLHRLNAVGVGYEEDDTVAESSIGFGNAVLLEHVDESGGRRAGSARGDMEVVVMHDC